MTDEDLDKIKQVLPTPGELANFKMAPAEFEKVGCFVCRFANCNFDVYFVKDQSVRSDLRFPLARLFCLTLALASGRALKENPTIVMASNQLEEIHCLMIP